MSFKAARNVCSVLRRARVASTVAHTCKTFFPGAACHQTIRWSTVVGERQWSTPLAKSLAEAITTTGPISVANYMRQCLTSSCGGYYMTRNAGDGPDQFGSKGDFVTSPEINQIFGELIGIWFVAEWMAQGKPSRDVVLLELGPGRGTLMDDVLRTIRNFKDVASSVSKIFLVEASPLLRRHQHQLLSHEHAPLKEHEIGFTSKCKYLPDTDIFWTEDINFLPADTALTTPFIIAHEFFDALPVHIFQSTSVTRPKGSEGTSGSITTSTTTTAHPAAGQIQNEWRELLVMPSGPPPLSALANSKEATGRAEFELILSSTTTPHSQYLPTLSPRYKPLLGQPGTTIEISPSALSTANVIAALIGSSSNAPQSSRYAGRFPKKATPSGAALIVDYGPSNTIPINSIRGIREHHRCSPFQRPGEVDLSADVDFEAVADAALEGSEGVEVHGPVEQAYWLRAMGGEARLEALRGKGTDEVRKKIQSGWNRLVDRGPDGMGKIYKVMGIVPVSGGRRRPIGFGGGLS